MIFQTLLLTLCYITSYNLSPFKVEENVKRCDVFEFYFLELAICKQLLKIQLLEYLEVQHLNIYFQLWLHNFDQFLIISNNDWIGKLLVK